MHYVTLSLITNCTPQQIRPYSSQNFYKTITTNQNLKAKKGLIFVSIIKRK